MTSAESSSELRPYEFLLTYEDKQELRRRSALAGVSMSDYVRCVINSYEEDEIETTQLRSV